jgi:hypothetical protein
LFDLPVMSLFKYSRISAKMNSMSEFRGFGEKVTSLGASVVPATVIFCQGLKFKTFIF